jgi:serine/threonine protein phosphatase PrpC
VEIAVGSKPGTHPNGNVDAHVAEVIAPGVVLLAVAEGFGSVRGQAAPLVAALAIRDALRHRVRPDGRDARAALLAAFASANARVFAQSGSHDDFVASGSSLSAALIVGDRAHIAHVGATRAYLGRDGALTALTTDDELTGDAWTSARTNVPTEAIIGNVLTRTLGTQATLDATVTNVRLMHGDALVLATAAFHKVITDEEISHALRSTDSSETVTQRLLEAGNLRGAAFGGTVIVGRSLTGAPPPLRPSPTRLLRAAAIALTVIVIAALVVGSVFHVFLGQ